MPVWFIYLFFKAYFSEKDLGAKGLGFQPQFVDSLGESRKVTYFFFLSISVVRGNGTCYTCF